MLPQFTPESTNGPDRERVIPDPKLYILPKEAAWQLGVSWTVLKEVMPQNDIEVVSFGKLTHRIVRSQLPELQRLVREACGEPAPYRPVRLPPNPAFPETMPREPEPPPKPEPSLLAVLEEVQAMRLELTQIRALLTQRFSRRLTITETQRTRIYERDGNRCRYCAKRLNRNNRQIDHIVPVVRGGSNGDENLVAACRSCNYSKHDNLPSDANMVLLAAQGIDPDLLKRQYELAGQEPFV